MYFTCSIMCGVFKCTLLQYIQLGTGSGGMSLLHNEMGLQVFTPLPYEITDS